MPLPHRKSPDLIDKYLHYTKNTEPPEIYRKWCAVSTIAASLQRKVSFSIGNEIAYPNFYIILTGPSGEARKSTALRQMQDLLFAAEITMTPSTCTREALIAKMSQHSDIQTNDKGENIMHCSMTALVSELSVFIDFGNDTFIMTLTDWFDCADNWSYETRSHQVEKIGNMFFNMIAATTDEWLRQSLSEKAVAGGLTSRILFIYAPRIAKKIAIPGWGDDELIMRDELLLDMEIFKQMSGPFVMDEEYEKEWISWYEGNHNVDFNSQRLLPYNSRRPMYMKKLSMVCSASRSNEMICRKEDFKRALELLCEAEDRMDYVFGGMGMRKDASVVGKIMRYIAMRGSVPMKDLVERFHFDMTWEDLNKTLDGLTRQRFSRKVIKEDGSEYIELVNLKFKGMFKV